MQSHKVNQEAIQKKYLAHKKITMLTCYDSWSADIIKETMVDLILVGDSVAMVQHGYTSTIHATVEMMALHTAAVARSNPKQMIVTDLPFLSYRKSLSKSMAAVEKLLQSGAEAVKLEGVEGNEGLIQHIVHSGIPVMGHIGLTPQHIHQLNGHKVQGKTSLQAEALVRQAKCLESLGCFAIVLECIPASLATRITQETHVPTIGIGAGPDTSGQVLVLHDMLGLNDFQPKFLKKFLNGKQQMKAAIEAYCDEVSEVDFPYNEHCYSDENN